MLILLRLTLILRVQFGLHGQLLIAHEIMVQLRHLKLTNRNTSVKTAVEDQVAQLLGCLLAISLEHVWLLVRDHLIVVVVLRHIGQGLMVGRKRAENLRIRRVALVLEKWICLVLVSEGATLHTGIADHLLWNIQEISLVEFCI